MKFIISLKGKKQEKLFPILRQQNHQFLQPRHQVPQQKRKTSTRRSSQPSIRNKINKKKNDHASHKFLYECFMQFLIFKTLIDSNESLIISNKSNSFPFTIASNLFPLMIFFAMAKTSSTPLNYGL